MLNYDDLSQSVIAGKPDQVRELTRRAIDSGADLLEIINHGLTAGMTVVGARFKSGEMFIPEVIMSARAMSEGMELIKPLLAGQEISSTGKVILGTVQGDLHDIGRKLVLMMLESAGFSVIDLGIDVRPEKFIQAVREHKPDIVGMSALLTTTMVNMKDTIDALKEEGLKDQVKVIIGGAPISQDFADAIGADGFAPNAGSAAELCRRLVGH